MSEPDPPPPKLLKKTLCDWSKRDLREHFDLLQAMVENPRYACLKCGRAAHASKSLCKPKRLG